MIITNDSQQASHSIGLTHLLRRNAKFNGSIVIELKSRVITLSGHQSVDKIFHLLILSISTQTTCVEVYYRVSALKLSDHSPLQ